SRSDLLFARSLELLPGGVSSPVRAFGAVGGTPRFIARGRGAWLEDVDGRRLLDLVLSYGPLLLGHGHPEVRDALRTAVDAGWTFGAPTEAELALAERISRTFPSIEMVRFVTSGTEAVMSAVRLARAATERRLILKFAGCYHGHADALLAAAGSGVATLGLPDGPGIPASAVADTRVLPFNDLAAVERAFAETGEQIAAVIVEPVAGNMGVVPPVAGFLEGLRRLTTAAGSLLVFDEVMTGWRVHPRGAQALFGVEPDLTCLGKVVGGGFPAAAYGGRRELMRLIAPAGPVYQAGTLAGHPVAMAAGIATLDAIEREGAWERAESWAARAAHVIEREAARAGVELVVQRVGTMLTPFFGRESVENASQAAATDRAAHRRFFHAMLRASVALPPSPLESWFTSAAHGDAELDHFERAVRASLSDPTPAPALAAPSFTTEPFA
ncbi:MAG: glutamate-1-semialdehyde 2,1-aminomutase, partial [Gemmatimonadales bacterium]